MKMCVACRKGLPLAAFGSDRSRSDGLNPRCRACAAEYTRQWRERNPERAATHRLTRDREKLRANQRAYAARKRAVFGNVSKRVVLAAADWFMA